MVETPPLGAHEVESTALRVLGPRSLKPPKTRHQRGDVGLAEFLNVRVWVGKSRV